MALLPRARPDEPRRKMRARDHHGQAFLQRAGSASDVRLHANYGRLRLHHRIPDWTRMARRPVEHHRRRRFGNHDRDHRERRETTSRGSGEWGVWAYCGGATIAVFDAPGSMRRVVQWTPDGARLAFTLTRGGVSNI